LYKLRLLCHDLCVPAIVIGIVTTSDLHTSICHAVDHRQSRHSLDAAFNLPVKRALTDQHGAGLVDEETSRLEVPTQRLDLRRAMDMENVEEAMGPRQV